MKHSNIFSEAIKLPLNQKKELIKLLVDSIAEPEQSIKKKKKWNEIGSVQLGKDYDNINIIFPIANFYAQNSENYDRFEWFHNKIRSMQGTDLWYMLQFFGEYLMNAPVAQQKEGAVLLEDKARNNNSYYIRLAAYQALGLLELDDVEKIRQDIRNKETDSRLNQIYMNME